MVMRKVAMVAALEREELGVTSEGTSESSYGFKAYLNRDLWTTPDIFAMHAPPFPPCLTFDRLCRANSRPERYQVQSLKRRV